MGFGGIVILPPCFGCVDRLKLQDGFSKFQGERRVFSLMDLWPRDFLMDFMCELQDFKNCQKCY